MWVTVDDNGANKLHAPAHSLESKILYNYKGFLGILLALYPIGDSGNPGVCPGVLRFGYLNADLGIMVRDREQY